MTQRIELTFFWIRLNESIPFFWMWLDWNLGWKKSKNWTFLTQNWTFLHMTRRIELLFVFEFGLKELNLLLFDSKNWAFSYLTQCIELFSCFPQRIHWVTLENKKGSILWVISEKKKLNPLSRIGEFQLFESYSKKKKFNFEKKRVIFKKKKNSVIRIEKKKSSVIRIRTSKKNSILRVIVKKKGSILRVIFWKIFWKEGSSLWVIKSQILWVFLVKKTKSLSHVIKKGWILRVIMKNLWVILKKKSSVLCIVFLVKAQFFESFFFFLTNSKIQFFDSCSRNFNSLSHFFEKILRVMLKKVQFIESCSKRFNSLNHTRKKVQFFEFIFWKEFHFFWKKRKKTSQKNGFDSLSHTPKRGRFYFFCHAQKKIL